MQFTLTVTGASVAQLQDLLTGILCAEDAKGNEKPVLSITPTDAVSFPDVPDATGKGKKPKKEKPVFVDPGDKEPTNTAAVSADPFATATPRASITDMPIEVDDFGDPIAAKAPAQPATKLTIDLLRTTMQAKSTSSPEAKAKCQALIASYNVQTMSMISENLWPELYAKIQAI